MMRTTAVVLSLVTLLFPPLGIAGLSLAGEGQFLWQIGTADNSTTEFALGPKGWQQFKRDSTFVVGLSDSMQDWSYVQPGPADSWAGSRQHTSTIRFGLRQRPSATCRLRIDLADAHGSLPPELAINVNGKCVLKRQTLAGSGDASIHGDLSKACSQRIAVEIAPVLLRQGRNEIAIRTLSGSWVLYDSVGLEAPKGVELLPVAGFTRVMTLGSPSLLVKCGGKLCQPIRVTYRRLGSPVEATVTTGIREPVTVKFVTGSGTVDALISAVDKETLVTVDVASAGQKLFSQALVLKPVRKWVFYLLPQSHVDIGYTHHQSDVQRKQWDNLEKALDLSTKTADYPPEARFKWNAEVLWPVDSYLREAAVEKQQRLIDAIRAGQFELNALYGNELTGLCRPEELLRLMDWGIILGRRCGVKVESAMISDVPGCTWGTVAALAEAGVKYFSVGMNLCDRVGRSLVTWEDKPFYWLGPDGHKRVLLWVPYKGYSLGHSGYRLDQSLPERIQQLEQARFPYDLAYFRWAVGGDNGPPDATLSDVVKNWNAKYAYPKMVISTTTEFFREFEKRYGDKLPVVGGDFTPYWEDGAGSSARETAANRTAAERIAQAEALSAMLGPQEFPAQQSREAWRNVLLYNEHTWGAWNSISEPDKPFVTQQWKTKRAFALDAESQSRKLLADVLGRRAGEPQKGAVDVFNTSAWTRTDLVVLGKELSAAGDVVIGPDGRQVPSQRLSTGELAFLAKDLPGLAGRRYMMSAGKALGNGRAKAHGTTVGNSAVVVKLDPASGVILSLQRDGINAELSDMKSGVGLNRYYYVPGTQFQACQQASAGRVSVKEAGPLVASLVVESDAPGCTRLSREVRVVDGLGRVDIVNTLDKKAVRKKEAVHFGFAFNVPSGVMRIDIPWAVFRPEVDQIPGSCKEWLSVGRWADISNDQYGVTWATLDAPLMEVGGITADKIGSYTDPKDWRSKLDPSQTLFSWVMNNYWHTNYKADQEGVTTFRYSLLPHKQYDPAAAQRFGTECSQPLVAVAAQGLAPRDEALVQVDSPEVLIVSIKPSEDRQAWILRLFNVGGQPVKASLCWGLVTPKAVWRSNLAEEPLTPVAGPIEIPGTGMITVRAVLP